MDFKQLSGLKNGLWIYQISAKLYGGFWSDMIRVFWRNITILRFQVIIRVSGGIQKTGDQGN